MHVATDQPRIVAADQSGPNTSATLALEIAEQHKVVAEKFGATAEASIESASSTEAGILQALQRTNADFVLLGVSVRAGQQRAFYGHRVEEVLKDARCTVCVLSVP